ncbi:hypothetical protein FAIPA1_300029 [Frankia sp. AiPs1]
MMVHHSRPAGFRPILAQSPSLPCVATDRPWKTSVSLLQGYEGANRTHGPVEATSPRTSSATAPENHHGQ